MPATAENETQVDETAETPVDETVEAPVETPAEETVEEPAAPGFLERMTELGFDGVEDESQGRDRLLESYSQLSTQIQELQEQNQNLSQLAQYGNQHLEMLRQQEQQAQQPAEQKGWWNPPEIDQQAVDRYRKSVTNPETGEVTQEWVDGTPAGIRTQYGTHQQYLENWVDGLAYRPQETLDPVIESVVTRMLDERLSELQAAQRADRFAERVVEEDGGWLYEVDPRTNQPRVDPITGDRILTADGKRVMEYSQYARSIGISDPVQQWEYATAMHHRDVLAAEHNGATTATTAAQKAVDKKMQHLQNAARGGRGRGGTVATAQDTNTEQNPDLSAGQKLIEQLRADAALTQ